MIHAINTSQWSDIVRSEIDTTFLMSTALLPICNRTKSDLFIALESRMVVESLVIVDKVQHIALTTIFLIIKQSISGM